MLMSGVSDGLSLFTRIFNLSFQSAYESRWQRLQSLRPNLTTINLLKKNSLVFRRRLIITDRLPVCQHFGADIVTLLLCHGSALSQF